MVEPGGPDKELALGGHSWEWDDEFGHGPGGTMASPSEEVFDLDTSPTHQIAGLLPHIEMVKPAEVPFAGHRIPVVSALRA